MKSHPLVSIPADALVGRLVASLDSGELADMGDAAFESILDSTLDSDWLSPARHEDVDSLAEQVVDDMLNDPELRNQLVHHAKRLIRLLMEPG